MSVPVVALVGRPNVGKSTLFNCLTRSRDALVADFPGLTRDRQYGLGRLGPLPHIVVDTGGLGSEDEGLGPLIERQAQHAIDEADVVVLLVDARMGLTPVDEQIAHDLRRTGTAVVLAANKAENLDPHVACAEFHALGFDSAVAISASHGRGVQRLVRAMLEAARARAAVADDKQPTPSEGAAGGAIRLAVVGRPNVGKSTLVNRLAGTERVVTYGMPGTTRDTVEIPVQFGEVAFTVLDTAGVRRRSRVRQTVEKFSVIKTLKAIESAHVTLLMLDARQEISEQDATLLGFVVDCGRAVVIAVNKWDGLSSEQRRATRSELQRRLSFIDYARTHFVSALRGSGTDELLRSAEAAFQAAERALPTAELTRVLGEAVQAHQPPLVNGRRVRLRYAHQGGRNPPLIIVHGRRTEHVPNSYRRYLVNTYRKAFALQGTPVRVEFRSGENPYAAGGRSRGR